MEPDNLSRGPLLHCLARSFHHESGRTRPKVPQSTRRGRRVAQKRLRHSSWNAAVQACGRATCCGLVAAAWRVLLWIDGAQVRSEFWSSMLLGALDLYIAAYAAWAATMCGFLQVVVGWRGRKQERGGGA